MDPLPDRVRLIAAPGALRDVELEVLGWRVDDGETLLTCRLVDGSVGRVPARWTDLPLRCAPQRPLGVLGSPAAWRLLADVAEGVRERRPGRGGVCGENGGRDVGQLALSVNEKAIAPAAVWETLPLAVQRQVTVTLARLLAQLVEAERDE